MENIKKRTKKVEVLFWSIALPGFGQLLNQKFVKGIVLIILEVMINIKGNVNIVIMNSFLGEMEVAIEQADFLWLMFYPCVYLFAIWDAYRDAGGDSYNYLFLPYVFSAYIGTLGVIYSPKIIIFEYLLGPVFLPIIGMLLGFVVGETIRRFILLRRKH